jgi:hypothetical protein
MIEDEIRRRRVADDIASQSARPMPKEINPRTLIAAVIAVAAVAVLVWMI